MADVSSRKKQGKKNRKHGRNKDKCERYRRANRRELNKQRRAARIQRGFRSRSERTGEFAHLEQAA